MKKIALPLIALAISVTAAAPGDSPQSAAAPASVAARTFEFTYTIRLSEAPPDGKTLRLWIPVPVSDGQQEISNLEIKSPVPYQMREEKEYHDHYAYAELDASRLKAPQELVMTFRAARRENRVALEPAAGVVAAKRPVELKRALKADRLVPLDGPIGDLSRAQTKNLQKPLERARAIYDFVLSTMRYDKTGEGWGRGDAIFACNAKKGNCTDFHALFIGMMRAAGIPARFEIGFPLPRDKNAGDISGYHCWAQFWVDGLGWIPVDASEAWKDPSRRDYFFGAHDANRVLFTRGRDIRLDPAQQGDPLNYFVYPYAELDGKPWPGAKATFSFRDLQSS